MMLPLRGRVGGIQAGGRVVIVGGGDKTEPARLMVAGLHRCRFACFRIGGGA